eukprot:TRINITY_DN37866_c0_g1_i1.p1 TRINITY_DN37866_c0_g1~~TRINITY_DN37866_c0_g1_i1.p1  ORF type:complete len:564 (-),score=149.44 TRINITY_DN37866_c0_g1_i1:288-1979(-)
MAAQASLEIGAGSDDDDEAGFDFAALAEAQQLAGASASLNGNGSELASAPDKAEARGEEKKKKRGGAKESTRRRQKRKMEEYVEQARKAGLVEQNLRDEVKKRHASKSGISTAASSAAPAASREPTSVPAAAVDADSATVSFVPSPPSGIASVGPSTTGTAVATSTSSTAAAPETVDNAAASPAATSTATPVTADAVASASAVAPASAASTAAAPRRPAQLAYGEVFGEVDMNKESELDAVAVARGVKEVTRRVLQTEAACARTVFVINLPFKATEQELRDHFSSCGRITNMRLTADQGTSRPLGYAHVQFEDVKTAEIAVEKCDKWELHDRVVRVTMCRPGEKFMFELPSEYHEDIRALMKEAYEGKNISTIRDAWQKRHPGQKLNATKWGFKNFSSAVATIDGVVLEKHLEKTLTLLLFFRDSPAHVAFLASKRAKEAAGAAAAADTAPSTTSPGTANTEPAVVGTEPAAPAPPKAPASAESAANDVVMAGMTDSTGDTTTAATDVVATISISAPTEPVEPETVSAAGSAMSEGTVDGVQTSRPPSPKRRRLCEEQQTAPK